MYKDVWKRFGAKILIVLCSVLLLGGVAIAVPKLMAVTKISLENVSSDLETSANPISGAALKVVNENNISYDGTTKTPSLKIEFGGSPAPSPWILSSGDVRTTSYEKDASGNKGQPKALKDAGKYVLEVEARNISNYLSFDGKKRLVSYEILPDNLKNHTTRYYGNGSAFGLKEDNVIVIGAASATLNASDINVEVDGSKLAQGSDYSITGAGTIQLQMGQLVSIPFEFTNYYTDRLPSGQYDKTAEEQFTIKQDINTVANANDVVLLNDKGQTFAPTSIHDKPASAQITGLSSKTDFDVDAEPDPNSSNTLVVRIKGKNNYAGEIPIPYTISTNELEIVNIDSPDPIVGNVYEYNESKNSYVIDVNSFTLDDGTILIPGTGVNANCIIGDTCIVDDINFRNPIPGQTAGLVMMEVKVTSGSYKGRTGYAFYGVRRDITKVDRAAVSKDTLIFDGTDACKTPELSVKDQSNQVYSLVPGTDYKITYLLAKRGADKNAAYTTTNAKKDAGKVFMKVEGIESSGTGGYYGTMDPTGALNKDDIITYASTLTYTKEPKPISKNDAEIVLSQDIFNRNCTASDVKAEMTLYDTNGDPMMSSNDLEKECTIKFLDPTGVDVDWDDLQPSAANKKDYTVQCIFKGNFDGTLSANFGISDYDGSNVTITYEACDQDGATTPKKHIYTGAAHKPKPIIWSNDENRKLDEGKDYTLAYENNKEATTNGKKAVLKIQFSKNNVITKEFEINPRPVKNDTDNYVEFLSPFTGDKQNGYRHGYSGQLLSNQPKPNKLRYRFMAGTKEVRKELVEGTDFDYPTDGWLCSDQYGTLVAQGDRIEIGKDYYFRIIPKGNYEGDPSEAIVGPFQYDRRDIGIADNNIELNVNGSIPMKTYNSSNPQDLLDWLNNMANLSLMDNGLTTPEQMKLDSVYPDYSISSTIDKTGISKNGTIEITINGEGGYTGTLTGEVYVGTNIAQSIVYEPRKTGGGTHTIAFSGNEVTLKEEYLRTSSTTDPYDLKFGSSSGVNLYDGGTLDLQTVSGDSTGHYRVVQPFNDPDYAAGIQYASVKLQGVNGYYGEVTVKINVQKINFNDRDYEIVFDYDDPTLNVPIPVYTGDYQEPSFKVYRLERDASGNLTGNKTLVTGGYDAVWDTGVRNINANEDWTDPKDQQNHWGKLTIVGKDGYNGQTDGYFKILKRDISDAANELNSAYFSFEENTLRTKLKDMEYIPYTTYKQYPDSVQEITERGPRQQVRLYFFPNGNPTAGTELDSNDYEYYCTNDEPTINGNTVTGNRTEPKAGTPWAVIKGRGNFKGIIKASYNVSMVELKEDMFDVRFLYGQGWNQFTGDRIHPTVRVFQKENATDTEGKYELTVGTDYTVRYGDGDTFISKDYKNLAKNLTFVEIIAASNGNYTKQFTVPYVIYGELTNNSAANSRVYYSNTDKNGRLRVQYAEDRAVMYNNLGLVYQQKRALTGSYPTTNNPIGQDNDQYPMTILQVPATAANGDYTVREGSSSTIGYGEITIDGTSNRTSEGLIAGTTTIDVLIWANLNTVTDQSPGLWDRNGGSSNITVTGAGYSASDLSNALQSALYISCGGRELKYGDDYVFEPQYLSTDIGTEKPLKIIPSDKAKNEGYLEGETIIHFNLTSSLSDVVVGKPIESTYIYAHGRPLVSSNSDFKLTMSGNELINGQHYTVTIKNEENEVVEDAINRGRYTYVIEGKGHYSGRLPQGEFEILPFNLSDNKDKVDVRLVRDTVTYIGKPVYPEIDDVVINIGNNVEKSLKDPNFNDGKNYTVGPGSGGDNTNWTDIEGGAAAPLMRVEGIGNYSGFVEKAYTIEQKDISSDDILIEKIENQKYNNHQPVKPYPEISYIEKIADSEELNILMKLNGEEYNQDKEISYKNWIQDRLHFTFEYLDDVRTAGTGKRIRIRGVGNFKGSREITYDVDKLNLSDTRLTFLSEESPVYDGTEQTPAFKLSYGDIDILTFVNGTTSSNYIDSSNVSYRFENNIDASDDNVQGTVTVEIQGDNDNYEGKIVGLFKILPAPLENHVRFMYRPVGSNSDVDLSSYKLNLPFQGVGSPVYPGYADTERELAEGEIGMYYNHPQKANHGKFLIPGENYYNNLTADENGFKIEYKYVEPDTDDTDIREEYRRDTPDYAGKVKVTITGRKNYAGTASFWYFIGEDISTDAKISISPTTTVFNAQKQYPEVKITGVDRNKCKIGNYRDEVKVENLIRPDDFINAGTYYIRVEGDPTKGTYATKPETLTYTITPRAFSNSLVIDGFKREYSYTGYDICPVGISVTDYIDRTKYKLTEDVDYTLTYTNNLNAGTAYINIKGQNNFSGTASANFLITSSTISSGGTHGSNSFLDQGTGEISGATSVAPSNVNMSMDTIDAMYYTGKPLYPKISIAGMTENIDYTVTFSNNVEVGTAVATINGIGNNTGTITKNFRIIAQLSKCTISPIPAQQYTGSEVKPSLTVRCGNSILTEGTDYSVTYSNNVNIGTATATLRALNNANYTGTTSVKFSIGNDVGGFIISGYAPSYAYTGKAITPGVVVETGSRTLVPGTEYTVSYSNNVNAGTATITVTGVGRYSGKQTANFIIEPKSIQSCDTTDVQDRTYTGDAYTPDVTVSDGGKVLTKGVDYTVTYTNNTNPGMASILIQGTSSNYSGTKIVSFKISAVAVKGLKASNVKYNSLKLKWTKQGYADGYQICDSKSKVIKTVKTNSTTISGLTAGKTYKYKVRSYIRNADGTRSYGAFSSVLNATTKLRTPKVKVVSNAKGQARISWSKVSGASGYEIYYKKSSGAKYKKLKTVNSPNIRVCTVRGMKSGDRAYFRIRAFRKNGSKKVYSSLNPLKVITVK